MMRFFSRMLKLPVSFVVAGMEILVRSMQDAQRSFEQGVDDVVRDFVGSPEAQVDSTKASAMEVNVVEQGRGNSDTILPLRVEEQIMYGDGYEPDLSGQDVKNISYWITFLKPDYQASLQERRDKTIDYSTTAQSFASERFGEFLDRLHAVGIEVPSEWKDLPSADYVLNAAGRLIEIPQRDRRYIDVKIEENWRRPKQAAEYDKEQVDVLKQIRDRL
jgi:hypothetical protein